MALKYPSLNCLAIRKESWVWSFLALRVAVVNPLGRMVRRGVHQGLDLEKGRERGVEVAIVEVRTEQAEENQRSTGLWEGDVGVGGICQALSFCVRVGQSVSCHRGLYWFKAGVGVKGK